MIRSVVSVAIGIVVGGLSLFVAGRGVEVYHRGFQTSEFDVAQGRKIFEAKCARCHNLSGTATNVGPNLSRIGELASSRRQGLSASGYLLESIMSPGVFKAPGSSGEMPSNLMVDVEDEDVRSLVAFLVSRGGQIVDSEIATLEIVRPDVHSLGASPRSRDQLLRGEALYRGKAGCVMCHPSYGRPEFESLAPYLFHGGSRDRESLRKAITNPHETVAPKYRTATVVLTDGTVVSGQLLSQNDETMILQNYVNGVLTQQEILLSEIELNEDGTQMIQSNVMSIMPNGIQSLLTEDEFDDLLTFLQNVN